MERVPLTLVTGFLGAGKTTLLNRWLADPGDERLAVVVNEFGDLDVDGRLVRGGEEQVVQLEGGCLCCEVRGDLLRTLHDLLDRRARRWFRRQAFDRVVVEASGLADPGPALQTLHLDERLARELVPDGVVCLVDARHGVRQLAERPEAGRQLAHADLVVVNHVDQVAEPEREAVRAAVAAAHGAVPVREVAHAAVEPAELRGLVRSPEDWLARLEARAAAAGPERHAADVTSVGLRHAGPVDDAALRQWLGFLAQRRGQDLLRVKGLVRRADAPPLEVHGVHQWLEFAPRPDLADAAPEDSVLVLIGRGLDRGELRRGWDVVRGVGAGA